MRRLTVLALALGLCACQGEPDAGTPVPPPSGGALPKAAPSTSSGAKTPSPKSKPTTGMPHAIPTSKKPETPKPTPAQLTAARRKRTRQSMDRVAQVIRAYHAEQTPPAFPPDLWTLTELEGDLYWIKPKNLRDAWGNDLIFITLDAERFTLTSVGGDNAYGGEDDQAQTYGLRAAPEAAP